LELNTKRHNNNLRWICTSKIKAEPNDYTHRIRIFCCFQKWNMLESNHSSFTRPVCIKKYQHCFIQIFKASM
jgi:hypothetical protein